MQYATAIHFLSISESTQGQYLADGNVWSKKGKEVGKEGLSVVL